MRSLFLSIIILLFLISNIKAEDNKKEKPELQIYVQCWEDYDECHPKEIISYYEASEETVIATFDVEGVRTDINQEK